MLLSALPGEEKPVSDALYRRILHAVAHLSPEDDGGEVTEAVLAKLGCSAEEARRILARLERTEELEIYLRNLREKGIHVITRISAEYSQPLRKKLGEAAPLNLFCAGNLSLLKKRTVSLVGSRALTEQGRTFARKAGEAIARNDFVYCSGGASGADTEGFLGAMEQGGSAVLFLPDSLEKAMEQYAPVLKTNRLLLVSLQGTDLPFSPARAAARNRLIHAHGDKVLVAQSDYGTGGTWSGTVENLSHGWSPVYACGEEPVEAGIAGLLERGAQPVLLTELPQISELSPMQTSLFD